ncbi:ABC transporter ATP-binding protein [Fervidobacterium pennivorans subsp. shakshaketiis]|uniref:ABC transporter ATP-binding protein n=1 Tax=Fervidobacterium pennivorans TaxID=93466 RepID=UPI00355B71E5
MKFFSLPEHIRESIRKFERKYRGYYPLFFFLEALFLIFNILTPLLIKSTIDSAFYKGSVREILLFAGLYLLVLILQSFVMYKLNYSAARYLVNNSRIRETRSTYAKLLSLPLDHLSPQNAGDYLSVFTRDIPKAVSGIYLGRLQILFNLGFFAVVLVVLFFLNVKLTIAVLVSIFLFYLSTLFFKKLVIRTSQKDQESYQTFMKRAREVIEGTSTLKQFSASSLLKNFLDSSAREWSRANIKYSVASELSNTNIDMNRWIGSTLVLAFGIYLLWKEEISVGTLVAFQAYMSWIYDTVRMVLTGLTTFFSSLPNWENFTRIFSLPFEKTSGRNLEEFEKLEAEHVEFSYSGNTVLTNIDMKIKRGDKIAIVGASGVGKSTLVSLFNRLLSPTKGKILINNIPIEEYSLSSLRKSIILVRSNDMLFDTSIRNNITFFEHFPKEEIEKVLKICECDFVERLENGIDTPVGEKGAKLSDGQRQRILLARALLRKPEVLILDEATSGIDSETEERILERILKEINTVIIISHRLSTIKKARKVYVLDSGRILDSGTHEELMSRCERYRELLEKQFIKK